MFEEMENRMLKSMAVITHNLTHVPSPDAGTMVNSLSKRLFGKQVVIAPVDKRIDVFVSRLGGANSAVGETDRSVD
ncbi:hypothetical protein C0J52_25143 [Blattella germanica]|nr:hypothetical protein C0J52_25143 [Blattella germanica]